MRERLGMQEVRVGGQTRRDRGLLGMDHFDLAGHMGQAEHLGAERAVVPPNHMVDERIERTLAPGRDVLPPARYIRRRVYRSRLLLPNSPIRPMMIKYSATI
jgi:hypothetical protein